MMKSRMLFRLRTLRRLLAATAMCAASLPAFAATTDGGLSIEIISAYNLVVDSNIETPAGRSPNAAHFGATVCNTGGTPLTNVLAYIGDFLGTPATSTPGLFPSVTDPTVGATTYFGTFNFWYVGETQYSTRFVGDLAPGECRTVYWLVEYPLVDDTGNALFGAQADLTDDLTLDYDIWATGTEGGVSRVVEDTRTMTLRSELTASANKIWPNTDSKVPNEYLDAIEALLGWRPLSDGSRPTEAGVVQGVWYDFGTVRHGFDNDGDLVSDYNAWIQPVGDAGIFDVDCFRMTKVYGILIVKRSAGDMLIPFEDEMYFTNIPEDNTGMVGLVFYEFTPRDGVCSVQISPYQEVASGREEEKFNADYGVFTGLLTSQEPDAAFDKRVNGVQGPASVAVSGNLSYTLEVTNTSDTSPDGPLPLGNPLTGMHLNFQDSIPDQSTYVAGSAGLVSTTQPGLSVSVLYSTNNGATWSATEPVPASDVTDLQWWVSDPLDPGESIAVGFDVTVLSQASSTDGTPLIIENTGGVGVGAGPPFLEDDALALLQGPNSISGITFEDDSANPALFANEIRDLGDPEETLLTGVPVTLYYDVDGDGELDASDLQWSSTTTNGSGAYSFTSLPDGNWIVEVERNLSSVGITCDGGGAGSCDGWTTSTEFRAPVDLDAASVIGTPVAETVDFGFLPAVSVSKTVSGGTVYGEGDLITYNIRVRNNAEGEGVSTRDNVEVWATNVVAGANSNFCSQTGCAIGNGVNPPDGLVAQSTFKKSQDDTLAVDGFNAGGTFSSILSVEAIFQVRVTSTITNDQVFMDVVQSGTIIQRVNVTTATDTESGQIGRQALNDTVINGLSLVAVDVTSAKTWTWADFNPGTPMDLRVLAEKSTQGSDAATLEVDAVGFRITAATPISPTGGDFDPDTTLSPVPLFDTFDANLLEFVSADIAPDFVDNVNGELAWNDVGPINSGGFVDIAATFRALEIPSGDPAPATANNAVEVRNGVTDPVNGAFFFNGLPANGASDDVDVTIEPRGSISGVLWSDTTTGTIGWVNPDGFEPGVDFFIPTVEVDLFACFNTNGTNNTTADDFLQTLEINAKSCGSGGTNTEWRLLQTEATGADGSYRFDALETGFYYVDVRETPLINAGGTRSADPDLSQNQNNAGFTCGTCESIWGNPGANLTIGNFNRLDVNTSNSSTDEEITRVNFGFQGLQALYGFVWNDVNADGVVDSGENPLSGWTVYASGGGCTGPTTTGGNCPTVSTDANGNFLILGLNTTTSYTVIAVAMAGWNATVPNPPQRVIGTLVGGEFSGSHDFGFRQVGTSTLGDQVYFDLDADAVFDAGEEGIIGVTAWLYEDEDGDGVVDTGVDALRATAVTDGSGAYLFTGLPAGNWIVVLDRSTGLDQLNATQDPDETGVCSICDGDGSGTVNGTNSDLTVDFGFISTLDGEISGLVFHDRNGNAVQDGFTETGIAGVLVSLEADLNGDGTYVTIATTTTGTNGGYLFENLPDGAFRVVVDSDDNPATQGDDDPALPDDAYGNDAILTTPDPLAFNAALPVSISGGVSTAPNGTIFGFAIFGAIGDTIFQDNNGNAVHDTSEPGIPGVTVRLYSDVNGDGIIGFGDSLLETTVTDAAGQYLFTALDPDDGTLGCSEFPSLICSDFIVQVETGSGPLANAIPSSDPDRDGIHCTDNSIPSLPACDDQTAEPITYGTVYLGADFGYQLPGVIGDTVFIDLDADGIVDAGEPTIGGVLVTLAGPALGTATTNGDGYYSFGGLPGGLYTVTIDATNFNVGGPLENFAPVSDFDGGNDNTAQVSLAVNEIQLDVDFGYQLNGTSSLSGTVCFEEGLIDGLCLTPPDDAGVAGRGVFLYDAGGSQVGSTTTDANGFYQFDNLPDGVYRVAISTATAPLTFGTLTTVDRPGITDVTNTGTSVIQEVTIAGLNLTGIDFAFEFTASVDFGDLPGPYRTLLDAGGAYHILIDSLFLGQVGTDAEPDGEPTAEADGDDVTNVNDDDGVGYGDVSAWTTGAGGAVIQVAVGGTVGSGHVVGWIDFNGDGDFTDTGEFLITSDVSNGFAWFSVDIPAGATLDNLVYSRFRVFETAPPVPILSYFGIAVNGEVEDYRLDFRVPGSIGDTVWLDTDGDGIQDIGEPGIANVTVNLYDNPTCSGGVPVETATTGLDGRYRFDGLFAGSYCVDVVQGTLPSGLVTAPGTTDPSGLVALANGQRRDDVDFGYVPTIGTAVIGDFVWVDVDDDGIQDVGEVGLGGVGIELVNAGADGVPQTGDEGAAVASTTTAADGSYLFSGVTPGTYYVRVPNAPVGYAITSGPQSPGRLFTNVFTVFANDVYDRADFGFTPNGALVFSITDTTWNDADGDGVFDGSEAPIAGVTVNLVCLASTCGSDVVIGTALSGAGGSFTFSSVPTGDYRIEITDVDGVLGRLDPTTTPATNGSFDVTVIATDVNNVSFGYNEPGGVAGIVWNDANANGTIDSGEAGIGGTIVELQQGGCTTGVSCPRTVTAPDGSYQFLGYLPDPGYNVVVNPNGFGIGQSPTDYASQTFEADGSLGGTITTAIVAGELDDGNDFGYRNTTLNDIDGTVFADLNADGVFQSMAGETGFAGVTLSLTNGAGAVIATATTTAGGAYSFPDLPDGDYTVTVTDRNIVLAGYTLTSGLDFRSTSFTLPAVQETATFDFGYINSAEATARIHDIVWLDSDGDGLRNGSEPGIAGVQVDLYLDDGDGVFNSGTDTLVASDFTDFEGNYVFDGLDAGVYFVDVTEAGQPNGPDGSLSPTTFLPGFSNAIVLEVGEDAQEAAFGFRPTNQATTVTLAGIVWVDADSDGTIDFGEARIPNVTVTVVDQNNTSTTFPVESAPDGSWMVTGLSPGDYFVIYDAADVDAYHPDLVENQPTNMAAGQNTWLVAPANAGEVYTNLDFGFNGANLGSIAGTVYLDENVNASHDLADEPGIRNVTLELYEVSGAATLVATAVSSLADGFAGDYLFAGLVAGTYQVVVTDANGIVVGLNQTELLPASIPLGAGQVITDQDAGYSSGNPLGSVGNLVFLDANGDGLFDIGSESGIAGVTLECWLDGNDNQALDIDGVTDNLVRTVTTGADGEYYCESLPTGSYVVRLTDERGVVAGLTQTFAPSGQSFSLSNIDDAAKVNPYGLQTSSPNLTADFGFRGAFSISGIVFEDVDNDAAEEVGAGDNCVGNATVRLYSDSNSDMMLNAGEPLVATRATSSGCGSNQNYIFAGLPAGRYIITVNVSGTSVAGYAQTTQTSSGGIQPVQIVASNVTDQDFGFYDGGITTTPVTLSSFIAKRNAGGIDFTWTTATETGNVGFMLYYEDDEGQLQPLSDLIQSHVVDSVTPQSYSYRVDNFNAEIFWLTDFDLFGTETRHGPFRRNQQYGEPDLLITPPNWAGIRAEAEQQRGRRLGQLRNVTAAQIHVDATGIQRVTYEDLDAAGVNFRNIPAAQLAMTSQGSDVPIYVKTSKNGKFGPGDYVEFYGEAIDTMYTGTNVYVLQRRTGQTPPRAVEDDTAPGAAVSAWHLAVAEQARQQQYSYLSPIGDPWYMDLVFARNRPVSRDYTLTTDNRLPGPVRIEVDGWGMTDFLGTVDHHIQVSVNGELMFDTTVDGNKPLQLAGEVDGSFVADGANTLRFSLLGDMGVPYSLAVTDAVRLVYPRELVARDNALDFVAMGDLTSGAGLTVTGFTTGDVVAYGVESNGLIRYSAEVEGRAGDFTVTLPATARGHHYVLTAADRVGRPAVVPMRLDVDIDSEAADYVMIAHPDFIDGLEPLAEFHRSRGLSVRVVNLEDIYNQYAGGVVDPAAIQSFVQHAFYELGTAYVLLVGGDSYDYRDYLGLGAVSFLPSYYRQTDAIVKFSPTDTPFADVDGDDIPDLAIGRFPVRNNAELEAMIGKTLSYAGQSYSGTAVFASDKSDHSGRFKDESLALQAQLPGEWQVATVSLDDYSSAAAKAIIADEINAGVALTSYFGHSAPTLWSFSGMFTAADAASLNNPGRPTVVTQWGCWNTYFVSPHSETMAHRFLLEGDRGAAAVMGASTLTKTRSDRVLGQRLVPMLAAPGVRVGDAVMLAKQSLSEQSASMADVLLGFNLLGDPALVIAPE